jgi:Methyltransferase FkbM domain
MSQTCYWIKNLVLILCLLLVHLIPRGKADRKERDNDSAMQLTESEVSRGFLKRAISLLHSGRCKHVYLDLGTNVGVQIKKLYEPHLYPAAPFLSIFDKYFGPYEKSVNRSNVCSFGFEPNPHWAAQLQDIDAAYNRAGFPVVIFTETAVCTHGRNMSFYLEPYNTGSQEDGASLLRHHGSSMPEVQVGCIPISQFINTYVRNRRIAAPHTAAGTDTDTGPPKVIAKMDIEGGEYMVLPKMILTGALCVINFIGCEFHSRFIPDPPKSSEKFLEHVRWLLNHTDECTNTTLSELDDESYRMTGIGLDHPQVNTRPRKYKILSWVRNALRSIHYCCIAALLTGAACASICMYRCFYTRDVKRLRE